MKRLSKEEYGCYLALTARSRSEDIHTQIGAALFDKEWRTISTGFNGFSAKFVPDESIFLDRAKKSCLINHAEMNAILYASRAPHTICGVYSPCIYCAKTIAASQIKNVFFFAEYVRGDTGLVDDNYKMIFDYHSIHYKKLDKESVKKIMFWLEKDKNFLQSLT
jgi:deoxycytidylate deaminase